MRPSSALCCALALLLAGGATHASERRDMAAALQGRLVQLKAGRLAPGAPAPEARYVAFYFGASWCGPCRAFVPELTRGYQRLRGSRAPVQIVFVSDDSSCGRMLDYMTSARMPWPAISCRDRDRLVWLQRARGAALPGLLVYDREGQLLISSWSGSGRSRPREALAELERLAARGSDAAPRR